MAVTNTTSKVQYDCNGELLVFPFAFRIFKPEDLTVILTSATGVDTTLTYGLGYSVAASMGGYVNGGSVTVTTVYATGNKLLIMRNLAYTQELDLIVGGSMPAEAIEAAFDRQAMLSQQLAEQASRAITMPVTAGNGITPVAYMAALDTAVTAAQTAQSGAETAQDGAVTAQNAAVVAQNGAITAKTSAETAQSGAVTAKTAAETARDAAIAAGLITMPPGSIIIWATEIPPNGYLECNGASLLRASYAALLGVLGTRYGAVDGTHFNLPDYRGRFLRGWDHGAGIDPDVISRTNRGDTCTGDNPGTKQADQFKAHYHNIQGAANTSGGSITGPIIYTAANVSNVVMTINNPTGSETRPVNINVMYCIKY